MLIRNNTYNYHYIMAGDGLCAIVFEDRRDGRGNEYYYTHTDYLGSMHRITDANQLVTEEYSFDAWGNRRNPDNWNDTNWTAPAYSFARGYTGHEHLDLFRLINMNGRVYDPEIGRFLSPDPYVQLPDFTQNYNRYSYVLNNPLMYTDPSGELFWVIPNIGWSRSGGLSLGVSVVVGIPGIASAQVGVGYSFGVKDATGDRNGGWYASTGITAMMTTAYMSYSSGSGWNVGLSAGVSLYSGFPVSSNFLSVGVNYNIDEEKISVNISAFSISDEGVVFNPSFSAAIYPEHTTNLVRGKGFRSNDAVLSNFVANNQHQDALSYFGFDGNYDNNPQVDNPWVPFVGGDYNAFTDGSGGIHYGNFAFDSYHKLKAFYVKESYHSNKRLAGQPFERQATDYNQLVPEERLGFIHCYKNQGLFYRYKLNWLNTINNMEFSIEPDIYPYTSYTGKWWHNIYKIPRLW